MHSSLGLGLPPSVRARQRSARAVAHTTTTTHITTTPTPLTSHFPIVVPTPRRPLGAIFLNGLPTPPDTPAHTAPAPQPAPEPEVAERPLLPTRRSRVRAARTAFHGTGAGLSFGLNVFGDDEPILSPHAPTDLNEGASAGYFPAPPPAELNDGEIEEEEGHTFRAI